MLEDHDGRREKMMCGRRNKFLFMLLHKNNMLLHYCQHSRLLSEGGAAKNSSVNFLVKYRHRPVFETELRDCCWLLAAGWVVLVCCW